MKPRPTDEQLQSRYTEPCFLRRFSDEPCPMPSLHDLAHLIPAQRLRAERVPLELHWKPVVVACRRHHHLFDNGFLRIPRDQLPFDVEAFAIAHGLQWSLDRDFGFNEWEAA